MSSWEHWENEWEELERNSSMGDAVGSPASENIQWKYNTATSHLLKAVTQDPATYIG